ncbi:MAG: YidC/Oxa1 family membrane protein insertase [Christensenellales bacterium]|nr:YidC/Oxa1 family membrane protein insertase [Christensenellales bacterium]
MYAFFQNIFEAINSIVGSHGWTVVIFTILIRLVLLPFDYKSRKSMRRMEKINPQLQALQKKYGNDREKLQRKQAELYRKEKINPLGSCLPMLLTFPVLIIMFGAMRNVANEELVKSLLAIQHAVEGLTDPDAIRAVLPALDTLVEPFLWIKNLWVADSPFNPVLPVASNALAAVGSSIEGLITAEQMTALQAFIDGEIYQNIILPHYGATVIPGVTMNLLIVQLSIYTIPNGYFILPVCSAVSQYLITKLTPQAAAQNTAQNNTDPTARSMGSMNSFMKWFFPIFSLWICATSNAAFSLYWVVTNLVSMAQQVIFKKYFEAQDAKLAARSEEVDKL